MNKHSILTSILLIALLVAGMIYYTHLKTEELQIKTDSQINEL